MISLISILKEIKIDTKVPLVVGRKYDLTYKGKEWIGVELKAIPNTNHPDLGYVFQNYKEDGNLNRQFSFQQNIMDFLQKHRFIRNHKEEKIDEIQIKTKLDSLKDNIIEKSRKFYNVNAPTYPTVWKEYEYFIKNSKNEEELAKWVGRYFTFGKDPDMYNWIHNIDTPAPDDLDEISIRPLSTDQIMELMWIDLPDGEPTQQWEAIVELIYDLGYADEEEEGIEFNAIWNWVNDLDDNTTKELIAGLKDILKRYDNKVVKQNWMDSNDLNEIQIEKPYSLTKDGREYAMGATIGSRKLREMGFLIDHQFKRVTKSQAMNNLKSTYSRYHDMYFENGGFDKDWEEFERKDFITNGN